MSGSDGFNRTEDFAGAPREEEADKQPVRIVITYAADGTVTAYRDGKPYGESYKAKPVEFAAGRSQVVFGTRHGTAPDPNRALTGKIFEARLYDRALSPEEVAAASSGTLVEIVADQMVTAALPPAQAIKAQELDESIADLSAEVDKLASELDSYRSKAGASGDAFFRIAHAILNSKELIYVY
jgi:outer membrane murein-binding lipoprotein Lpp